MTLHAWAALCLVPILVVHLLPRRWRVLRLRRASISGQTAGAASTGERRWASWGWRSWASWRGSRPTRIERVAGGVRRFTGSRWLPDGGVPPATTFFGEGVEPPSSGRVAAHRIGPGRATGTAVAGCADRTWARWSGRQCSTAPPDGRCAPCGAAFRWPRCWSARARILARATVIVRSATGWYASLPLDEARTARCWPPGWPANRCRMRNGAPCRLVAPDRRGLEWVKWVTEVEVSLGASRRGRSRTSCRPAGPPRAGCPARRAGASPVGSRCRRRRRPGPTR